MRSDRTRFSKCSSIHRSECAHRLNAVKISSDTGVTEQLFYVGPVRGHWSVINDCNTCDKT